MEEGLSEWQFEEIKQTCKYLSMKQENVFLLSNFGLALSNKSSSGELFSRFESFQDSQSEGFFFVSELPLKDCFDPKTQSYSFKEFHRRKQVEIAFLPSEMCLLDLRGKETLKSEDKTKFRVFVFGGILGDHPPKDRTKSLRENFENFRNLKTVQMSTDTAILVSDTILNYGASLDEIPMQQNPEFVKNEHESVQLEGFVYVTDELDLSTRKKVLREKPQLIMSEKIKKELIFKEFSFDKDFGFN